MKKSSPLRKMWDGSGEKEWGLIVIEDGVHINGTNALLNIIFSRISDYEYGHGGNPLQKLEFWKNIRSFIEFKHIEITRESRSELRRVVLSSRVYDYACRQEALFSGEIERIFERLEN